jgi:hypothetical protein
METLLANASTATRAVEERLNSSRWPWYSRHVRPLGNGVRRRLRGSDWWTSGGFTRCALAASLAISAVFASGCGDGSGRTVVRIGRAAISEGSVSHWTRALAAGDVALARMPRSSGSERARAVDFLIAAGWAVEEASRLGHSVSPGAVRRRLVELREAVPGGDSAFRGSLAGSGRTTADVELEIKAKLAASAIRASVMHTFGIVSTATALTYYRQHKADFRVPERREFDIVENLTSKASARGLGMRLGAGSHFHRASYHETFPRPARLGGAATKAKILAAIFRAQPGALSEPMRLNRGWSVFVVRRIVPARFRPFSAVRAEIVRRLARMSRVRTMQRFTAEYLSRWRAITSCRPGYVVAKCAQYRGGFEQEDPLDL